jgi:hypothetical protein
MMPFATESPDTRGARAALLWLLGIVGVEGRWWGGVGGSCENGCYIGWDYKNSNGDIRRCLA